MKTKTPYSFSVLIFVFSIHLAHSERCCADMLRIHTFLCEVRFLFGDFSICAEHETKLKQSFGANSLYKIGKMKQLNTQNDVIEVQSNDIDVVLVSF